VQEAKLTVLKVMKMVKEGGEIYLHSEVTHGEGNKAVGVAKNTLLTLPLLERLATQHGGGLIIHFGTEPIEEAVAQAHQQPTKRNFLGLMRGWAREEAKKVASQTFAFKSMLIQSAREWEAQLTSSSPSPLEARICQYAPLLQERREPRKFYSMLTRAVADALCAIYLDIVDGTKPTGRKDAEEQIRQQAIMGACLLKDIGLVADIQIPSTGGLSQNAIHPRVSAFLMFKDPDRFTLGEIRPERLKVRLSDKDREEAIRAVMEHENHATKSRLARSVVKGTLFCEWLLEQNMPDVPITKQDLTHLGHFDPLELSSYLNMAMVVKHEAIRDAAKNCAKENNLVRLQMYRRSLTTKGIDFPFETWAELDTDFHGFFSQFGDYSRAGYMFLRNLIGYFNILSRHNMGESGRLERLDRYSKKIANILL